jgi:hypothetical protein
MTGTNRADRAANGGNGHERGAEELVAEGWYLMSTEMLERLLSRLRARSPDVLPSGAVRLTTEEALAFRDAGNLPDERGRTLRLLLLARDRDEVRDLPNKRSRFEPDYHEAPGWRKEGSKPVTMVPLRDEREPSDGVPWWEEPDLAALESEWRAGGEVGGVQIPADYRGFVYKTILSLRAAGRDVTVQTIADSLARWLLPPEAAEIRSALERANTSSPGNRGAERPSG